LLSSQTVLPAPFCSSTLAILDTLVATAVPMLSVGVSGHGHVISFVALFASFDKGD